MKLSIQVFFFYLVTLAPDTELILFLTLPYNSLLSRTCHPLPPALEPSSVSHTAEARSPEHWQGSGQPMFKATPAGTCLPQSMC